jgi:hypothetical protein
LKQQVLETRLAEIEAIARRAMQDGGYAAAIVDIIRIVERKQ